MREECYASWPCPFAPPRPRLSCASAFRDDPLEDLHDRRGPRLLADLRRRHDRERRPLGVEPAHIGADEGPGVRHGEAAMDPLLVLPGLARVEAGGRDHLAE